MLVARLLDLDLMFYLRHVVSGRGGALVPAYPGHSGVLILALWPTCQVVNPLLKGLPTLS